MKIDEHILMTLGRIREGRGLEKFDDETVGSKAGRHNPVVSLSRGGIPVGKEYEKRVSQDGWGWVFSPEAWRKHPVATGVLFLNIFHGVCMEIARKSAQHAMRVVSGRRGEETVLALVEAISADKSKQARLTVRVPEEGGGFKRAEVPFGKVDDIRDFCSLLGKGIEIRRNGDTGEIFMRKIPGETAFERGVGLSRLSVYEIACVTEAMSKGYDFSGEWSRVELKENNGLKPLPPSIAGLYIHNRTKQGILVFRGTRPLSPQDWMTDIAVTHGMIGDQYSKIADTVRAADRKACGIIVAGHSKGGGMAQYAAVVAGVRAVTFNPIGLPENMTGSVQSVRINHYMTRYDWVGNMSGGKRGEGGGIAGPLAVARGINQRLLGDKGDICILRSTRNRYKFIDLHALDMVKKGLALEPKVIRNPFDNQGKEALKLGDNGVKIGTLAARLLSKEGGEQTRDFKRQSYSLS
jgi:hypothetical protein